MNKNNIDEIRSELDIIFKDFQGFQSTVYKLLHHLEKIDPTFSTTTRGTLISAGANAEIILKYIIKREGLKIIKNQGRVRADDNPNRPATLNDFIYTLKEILPLEVKNHLGTIQDWRNLSAHGNSVDNIDEITLESVGASMKYFVRWFFEDYLKGEYKAFVVEKPGHKQNRDESKSALNNAKSVNNVLSNNFKTSGSFRSKGLIKNLIILSLILVFASISTFYFFDFGHTKDHSSDLKIAAKRNLSKEEVYNLLLKYYSSQSDLKSDPHDYFSNIVFQFYRMKNINPTQIDIIRKTEMDYIDKKNSVDKASLSLHLETDSITYWRFWNDFNCYRTTKKKFQTCRVLTEFGFDNACKITSIKEIEIRGLRYSKKKSY